MAHHLAELIDRAEKSATEPERQAATKQTVDTILKVWEHRHSLPGTAYPLARYKDIIQVLNGMRPSANPWEGKVGGKRQQLAADLFGKIQLLSDAVLFMDAPARKSKKTPKALVRLLGQPEKALLKALSELEESSLQSLLMQTSLEKGRIEASPEDFRLESAMLRLADETIDLLHGLKSELRRPQEMSEAPPRGEKSGTSGSA